MVLQQLLLGWLTFSGFFLKSVLMMGILASLVLSTPQHCTTACPGASWDSALWTLGLIRGVFSPSESSMASAASFGSPQTHHVPPCNATANAPPTQNPKGESHDLTCDVNIILSWPGLYSALLQCYPVLYLVWVF